MAWDGEGNLIGGNDAGAQAHAALGGQLDDIVSLTTDFTRDIDKAAISDVRAERLRPEFGPAATGVRVAGLWAPDLLVELTTIALMPDSRFRAPAEG